MLNNQQENYKHNHESLVVDWFTGWTRTYLFAELIRSQLEKKAEDGLLKTIQSVSLFVAGNGYYSGPEIRYLGSKL
jgi:hypothetical protein